MKKIKVLHSFNNGKFEEADAELVEKYGVFTLTVSDSVIGKIGLDMDASTVKLFNDGHTHRHDTYAVKLKQETP